MRRQPFGIKHQLALWNAGVMLLLLLTVAALSFFLQRAQLNREYEARLMSGYHTVENVLIHSGGDLLDLQHLPSTMLFQVVSDDQVYTSRAWSLLFKEGFEIETAPGDIRYQQVGEKAIGIYSSPGTVAGYRLLFGLDATDRNRNLHTIASIQFGLIPFMLLLLVVAAYLLADRALSPIRSLTTKLSAIDAGSLEHRLPEAERKDELGKLATGINALLARIEQSYKRLEQFTSDAAHELRTPLAVIRSRGELLLHDLPAVEKTRDGLGSMLEEVDRLTGLTEDLLTLARGSEVAAGAASERIELNALIAKQFELLQPLAEEKQHSYALKPDEEVWVSLPSSTALERAIINLIHNAILYTPTGGEIVVSTSRGESNVEVEILDNGPGIPAERREEVFERFTRLEEGRSRASGGTGLGLAIARHGVQLNRGTIRIDDSLTGGCRMVVQLPH